MILPALGLISNHEFRPLLDRYQIQVRSRIGTQISLAGASGQRYAENAEIFVIARTRTGTHATRLVLNPG